MPVERYGRHRDDAVQPPFPGGPLVPGLVGIHHGLPAEPSQKPVPVRVGLDLVMPLAPMLALVRRLALDRFQEVLDFRRPQDAFQPVDLGAEPRVVLPEFLHLAFRGQWRPQAHTCPRIARQITKTVIASHQNVVNMIDVRILSLWTAQVVLSSLTFSSGIPPTAPRNSLNASNTRSMLPNWILLMTACVARNQTATHSPINHPFIEVLLSAVRPGSTRPQPARPRRSRSSRA